MLTLDVQRESEDSAPPDDALRRVADAVLRIAGRTEPSEISLRVVDPEEMQTLNERFRGKNKPTNVLSFPVDFPPELALPLLGDVVICAPIVYREAREQHKTPAAHWDHLFIHGVLHLLGFDHENEAEAQEMEALETRALALLGWPCPYEHQDRQPPATDDPSKALPMETPA